MSNIGPKNSKQELTVRKLTHSLGFRFRLHAKDLPGKPDLVFPKYRKVMFVNGCFWHAHEKCKKADLPETNKEFWIKKISGNKKRDKKNYSDLKTLDWGYLVLWQCEIKKRNVDHLKAKISEFLLTRVNS